MPSFGSEISFKGDLISQTRASCARTRSLSNIKISDADIDSFLTSLNEKDFNRLKIQHGVSFPLKFPSLLVEVNFLSVLSMLNTLSGYRIPLHKATGVGSYQNIVKLLMGLYLSSPESNDLDSTGSLSTKGLKHLSATTVAEILQVKLHVERPHESIPGLTVGLREGPINEAVELIVKACNETGEILYSKGYKCLGEFVMEKLKESEKVKEETKDEEKAANHFLENLVSFLPAFNDSFTFHGGQDGRGEVFIFKKAFLLLFVLHQRLVQPQDLYVPSPEVLPIFCDNVISTMLHHLGILDFSESVSESLRTWERAAGAAKTDSKIEGPILSKEDAYRVRAAAVDAGLIMKNRAHKLAEREERFRWMKDMSEADIDGYLWSVAKDDPQLRIIPRLVERNTIMY